MSTAAVSSTTSLLQYFQARQADLKQLGQDLKSGDLTKAQSEFNTIQALGLQGPFKNGDAFYRSDRQGDFQNIGSALQSGDLSAAERAFQQLRDTFLVSTPPVASAPSATGTAATNSPAVSNTVNVSA